MVGSSRKPLAHASSSWQQESDEDEARGALQLGDSSDEDQSDSNNDDDDEEGDGRIAGRNFKGGRWTSDEEGSYDSDDARPKSSYKDRVGYAESDEEEDSGEDGEAQSEEDDEGAASKQLRSVPFGMLAKAQRHLRGDQSFSYEANDSEPDEFEDERAKKKAEVMAQLQAQKEARQAGESSKGKGGKARDGGWGGKVAASQTRDSKHAPMEMTSRKPVSRKRTVIETAAVRRRDPRFSSLSASLPNAGIFESSYGFVREQQTSELKQLKATFNALRKQEANHAGPRARSEQALNIVAERERVEAALRRVEGLENERKRREHETQVMRRHKAEQKERIEAGGKQFYLKDSAKKALVLQDKFERLSGARNADGTAKEGGPSANGTSRQALRKALERRRKKNAQKERRDMPTMGAREAAGYAPVPVPKRKRMGEGSSSGGGAKRGKR